MTQPAPSWSNRLDKRQPAAGRCNAVLKNRGPQGEDIYCHKYPVQGRERCKHHGGMTMEQRRFDFGPQDFYGRGYARKIPARFVEMLTQFASDHDLLSLRAEIRLTDARVGELLQRMEAGEIPQAWPLFTSAVQSLRSAIDISDYQAAVRACALLEEALELEQKDREGWSEIQNWMEMRRKLADTEQKREAALQQFINTKQLMSFMGLIQQAIVEEVHDPHVLSALTRRIRQLANRPELPTETQRQLTSQVDEIVLSTDDEEPDHAAGQGGWHHQAAGEPDHGSPPEAVHRAGTGLGDHQPGAAGHLGGGSGEAQVPDQPGAPEGAGRSDPLPEGA